jgi:hypothetical protein
VRPLAPRGLCFWRNLALREIVITDQNRRLGAEAMQLDSHLSGFAFLHLPVLSVDRCGGFEHGAWT